MPVKAAYYGGNLTTTVSVLPIPIVTIVSADWETVTLHFIVQANTSYANSILTDGTDAALLALLTHRARGMTGCGGVTGA